VKLEVTLLGAAQIAGEARARLIDARLSTTSPAARPLPVRGTVSVEGLAREAEAEGELHEGRLTLALAGEQRGHLRLDLHPEAASMLVGEVTWGSVRAPALLRIDLRSEATRFVRSLVRRGRGA